MNKRILIDTDVLIDFLRGHKPAKDLFTATSDSICFSSITVAEIYSGIKDSGEEAEVERLFSVFPILPTTKEIARLAGRFVRQYGKSHAVEIPDALIAATCSFNQTDLQTLNIKHYPMFQNLRPPYKKS
ncbi:MAG: type II toxin-antitoxin system VapC family toxin [Chitinivibrionales bacterium]|nr:type II toxin-antitoxin system VapC family toxin [Chitinivibrionales bacterium]